MHNYTYMYDEPSTLARWNIRRRESVPTYLDEVVVALARPRTDLPDLAAFRLYCWKAHVAQQAGQEHSVGNLMQIFLGPVMRSSDSIYSEALYEKVQTPSAFSAAKLDS